LPCGGACDWSWARTGVTPEINSETADASIHLV
jgi:hypothetical protein